MSISLFGQQSVNVVSFFIFVIVCIAFSLPILLKIIHIRRTPTFWISALPEEGPVEVEGSVEPISPPSALRSPIGHDECVFWRLEVDQEIEGNWQNVYLNYSSEPFFIRDETSRIATYACEVSLSISKMEEHSQSEFGSSLPPELEATLTRLGIETLAWLGMKKTMRVREQIICPGDHVFVSGEISRIDGRKALRSRMITDKSEKEFLGDLYLPAAIWIFLPIIIGIIWWILSKTAK